MATVKPHSLRVKIMLWAGACLLLLGGALILNASLSVRKAAIEKAHDELHFISHDRALHLQALLDSKINSLRSLAEILVMAKKPLSSLQIVREETDTMLISILQRDHDLIGLYTCWQPNAFDDKDEFYVNKPGHDHTGRFAPYWYRNEDDKIDVMPFSCMDETIAQSSFATSNRKEMLSGPHTRLIDGEEVTVISIVVPLRFKDTFYGIVGLDISLTMLADLTADPDIDKMKMRIGYLNDAGVIIAISDRQEMVGHKAPEFVDAAKLNSEDLAHYQEVLLMAGDRIKSLSPVLLSYAAKPWWVCASLPKDVFTARAMDLTLSLISVGFGCVVFSMFMLWLITGRIVSPLNMLVHGVHKIRSGKYGHVVSSSGSDDEIGELAAAINSMSLEIARRDGERKRAAKELRRAKDDWEKTFESIPDIVTLQDDKMRITRVNKATCDLFQAPAEELIGKYCYEIFRGETKPCTGCPDVRASNNRRLQSAEIHHRNLDKIFMVSGSPIFDHQGRFQGFVHIARDITEQKQITSQLRQAQKMEAIGTLAGGIAHDFNNILAAIIGYSDLAKKNIPQDNSAKTYIEQVLKAGYRAKELVQQILAFSRQGEVNRKPIKIHLILKEALKLLRASIPTYIAIQQNINTKTGLVLADITQIHQLIMNLCTNAYHAMLQDGGTLTISLQQVEVDEKRPDLTSNLPIGAYIELEVRDTGIGMDQTTIEKIYDPYYTTKDKGKGTGLGLSVVRGIVQSHEGYITVESKPGKGTRFLIYLPVAEITHVETEKESLAVLPVGTENVLIVDDEEILVHLIQQMLEQLGYNVTGITSSLKALEIFQSQPDDFDLVLTDMAMPLMNGLQLSKKLLELRRDIPIVICTGYTELINEQSAQKIGIKKLLLKPLAIQEIAVIVREVLDKK
ncbi:MAG: response regulator [Desulfobulbaceae bacterium]|nr:response regulator [Desulfobulbaceae bacterium]